MTASRGGANLDIIGNTWLQLQDKHKPGAWDVLEAAYTESHRAYHTWVHIARLLEKLSVYSGLSTRPDLIALSAFWHDVVHKTRNADDSPRPDRENVRDSAERFRQFTLLTGPEAGAVHDMIMATASHLQAVAETAYYEGYAGDLDLFLDLDLCSLALPWEEFCADLARIRMEFSWVPDAAFYSAQIGILENFAKDDARLYRRAETSRTWREPARANLKRCINDLKSRAA